MTGVKMDTMERPLVGGVSDVAHMSPLPEDVKAFAQAMKAPLDDAPSAIMRQQGKTEGKETLSTINQARVSASAEKPAVNTVTQQRKAAMETPPQTIHQAQVSASVEKSAVNTVTQQGKATMETPPQTIHQAQASAEKPVMEAVAQRQEKTAMGIPPPTIHQAQESLKKPMDVPMMQQEKTVPEIMPPTGNQVQAPAENPVVSPMTQQERIVAQDALLSPIRTEGAASAPNPRLQDVSGEKAEPTSVQTHKTSPASVSDYKSGIVQTAAPSRSENAEPIQNVQSAPSLHISYMTQKGLKLDDERLMQALSAGEKRKAAKHDDISSLPPMNGPLDALSGTQMTGKVGAPSEMGPVNADLHIDNEMVQKCVERILVSRPEDGSSEVRIQIGRDILPDTEICLNRGVDGQLIVSMYTGNASSFQSMVAMRNDLLNNLERQENNAVRVEISFQNDAENGDMNRRSRGYAQQDDSQQN